MHHIYLTVRYSNFLSSIVQNTNQFSVNKHLQKRLELIQIQFSPCFDLFVIVIYYNLKLRPK